MAGLAPGYKPFSAAAKKRVVAEQARNAKSPGYQAMNAVAQSFFAPDLKTKEGWVDAATWFIPGGRIVGAVKGAKAAVTAVKAAEAAGKGVRAAQTASKAASVGVTAAKTARTTSTAARTASAATAGARGGNVGLLGAVTKGALAGAKAGSKAATAAGKATVAGARASSAAAKAAKASAKVAGKTPGVGGKFERTWGTFTRSQVLRPAEREAYRTARAAADAAQARFIKAGGKSYKGRAADLKTLENYRSSQARVNQLGRRSTAGMVGVAGAAAATGAGMGMNQRSGSGSSSRRDSPGALMGGYYSRGTGTPARRTATGPGAPMGTKPGATSRSTSRSTGGGTKRAAKPSMPQMAKGKTVSQSRTQWVAKGTMVNGKAVPKGYLAQYGKPGKRVTANVRIETPSSGQYTAGGGGQTAGGTKKGEVYAYKGGRRTGAMKKK